MSESGATIAGSEVTNKTEEAKTQTTKEFIAGLGGKKAVLVEGKKLKDEDEDDIPDSTLTSPKATKYYALRQLINLFLQSEKGEKSEGRKVILWTSIVLISTILLFEFGLIYLQAIGKIKLDTTVFLGTIGTITAGAVFILKTVAKSLYNDESDKVLNTIEKIVEKL